MDPAQRTPEGWNSADEQDIYNYSTNSEFDADGNTRSGGPYNSLGYDVNGYNAQGWNAQGVNQETQGQYNLAGYNVQGYNAQGYDVNGFNNQGIHKDTDGPYDLSGIAQDGNPVIAAPVTNVAATKIDNSSVLVVWYASSTGGNLLTYNIMDNYGNGQTTAGTGITFNYDNTNGNTYTYTITSRIGNNLEAPGVVSNDVVYDAVVPLTIAKPTISTSGTSELTVTWVPNVDEPYPITKYSVILYGTSQGEPMQPVIIDTDNGSTFSIVVPTLQIGDFYHCTVTAYNSIGPSVASDISDEVAVAGLPDPPTDVNLSISGNSLRVVWLPPANTGYSKITYYKVYDIAGNLIGSTSDPYDEYSNIIITELVTQVYMTATNAVGESEPSVLSNIVDLPETGAPLTIAKPTVSANAEDGLTALNVVFLPNTNETRTITKYTISVYGYASGNSGNLLEPILVDVIPIPGGTVYQTTIPNLEPGRSYYCTVIAYAGTDFSLDSDQSDTIIVARNPGPPTGVTLAMSGSDKTLSWTDPEFTGYSEIVGYTVFGIDGTVILKADNIISGLTVNFPNTQVYMKAKNAAGGVSIPSELSNNLESPTGEGPPSAPRNIIAEAGSKSAFISWEAPISSGGSTITNYLITSVPDNKAPQTVGADVLSVTMLGLISGTAYRFRVFALNSAGYSGQSNNVTPYAIPGTPKIAAPVLGNLTIALSWTAVPEAGSTITGYSIKRSDDVDPDFEIVTLEGGNTGTYTIDTGLTVGTPVTFTVTSISSSTRRSAPASITVTPISNPDAPPHFVAYVGKIRGTALLYWTPPSPTNGGTPLTGYVLTYNEIVINLATTLTFMVYVKDGVSVEFSLVAKNKVGVSDPITASIDGVYTDPTSMTVSTIPDPPPHIIAYVGKIPGTVNVHWVPQSPINGGTALTGYILTYNGITMNLAAGAVTFSDYVIPNQGITFKLVAKNKIGVSTELSTDILGGGDISIPNCPNEGGGSAPLPPP